MILKQRSRFVILLILTVLLISISVPVPAAEAQVVPDPVANAVIGLIRFFGFLNGRNRVYRAANMTAAEMNAYYDDLIGRMSPTEMGTQYRRLRNILEAERQAVIQATENYKRDAKHDFGRNTGNLLAQQLSGSKGVTKVLNNVRDTLYGANLGFIALHDAVEGLKPTNLLFDNLNANLLLIPGAQQQVVKLGSSLGIKLNNLLGGLPQNIQEGVEGLQEQLAAGNEVVIGLDQVVYQIMENSRTPYPTSMESMGGKLGLIRDGGMMSVLNNTVNNIMGLMAAMDSSGKPPKNADDMRETIRLAILAGHLAPIYAVTSNMSIADCTGASRAEYLAAAGQLGIEPEDPFDEKHAEYVICRNKDTEEIIHAYMIGRPAQEEESEDISEDEDEEKFTAGSDGWHPDFSEQDCTCSNYPVANTAPYTDRLACRYRVEINDTMKDPPQKWMNQMDIQIDYYADSNAADQAFLEEAEHITNQTPADSAQNPELDGSRLMFIRRAPGNSREAFYGDIRTLYRDNFLITVRMASSSWVTDGYGSSQAWVSAGETCAIGVVDRQLGP